MTIAVDASVIAAALIQQGSAGAWALDVVEHDELRMDLFDHRPFADRVWALRHSLAAYDAWYLALAESFILPLATLDEALMNATGPRCAFVTCPSS